MMKALKTRSLFLILFALFIVLNFNSSAQAHFDTPGEVVDELYNLVTFKAGTTPDWKAVKELFLDEAIIVLRTSYTESAQLNLDGFVGDFKKFIDQANVKETGFSETIVKRHSMVFGDIACFLVLYEAQITGSPRKTVGVDHFSLIKKNGEWRIVSITNELPTKERPIPKELTD